MWQISYPPANGARLGSFKSLKIYILGESLLGYIEMRNRSSIFDLNCNFYFLNFALGFELKILIAAYKKISSAKKEIKKFCKSLPL